MRRKSEFGSRLKALRKAANWTQRELAERAGITREHVAALECGRYEPSLGTANRLREALAVSWERVTGEH